MDVHYGFNWSDIDILPVFNVRRDSFCGGTDWAISLAWGPAEIVFSF
jgi:hypothetical protein